MINNELMQSLNELIERLDTIESTIATCRLALGSDYFAGYQPAEKVKDTLHDAENRLEKAISDFSEILEKNEGASNGN